MFSGASVRELAVRHRQHSGRNIDPRNFSRLGRLKLREVEYLVSGAKAEFKNSFTGLQAQVPARPFVVRARSLASAIRS